MFLHCFRQKLNDLYVGILLLVSQNFSLLTEPSVSPPEFSIICLTHGGPATTVDWFFTRLPNNAIFTETSQVIVDTSQNSAYENRLHVIGNYSGTCTCTIENNRQEYLPMAMNIVKQSIW